MKVTVVGTGAMGSVYAALLREAGHEVWALDLWDAHLTAIATGGLRVSGASGDRIATGIHVGRHPADAGPSDLWIVATKAHDVDAVSEEIAPLLRPDDIVMAFQNGLGAGHRLTRHMAPEHVVIGIAEGFGSFLPDPGHVHHEGMRLVRIGEIDGGLSTRVRRLEDAWREAGFNVRAFADIDLMIWEKFLCNVALSAPTAVFDCTVGALMADPAAWAVAQGCLLEAHRVGVAKGIAFRFEDPVAYVEEFASSIPTTSPSMRLDHLAGRASEVDVINGVVVDESRALGWPAPYNETLCAVLRAREARLERSGRD